MNIKELKNNLLEILHDNGIPELDITLKEYRNNPNESLGCYKSMSQFRARPIICVDIELHKKTLIELNDFDDIKYQESVMDTLAHEYGHVIEEFIRINKSKDNGQEAFKRLTGNFDDMEDFAELFGQWLNGKKSFLSLSQEKTIHELIEYYNQETFTPESLVWVKQEKWKRKLDGFLLKYEKSLEKYQTLEGSFNKCRQVSEAIGQRLSELMNVKILHLEDFKGDISNAHPKWQKLRKENMVHYVILIENEWILDLTSKQFNPENPSVLIIDKKDLAWSQVDVFIDYNDKKYKNLKP